MESYIRVSRAVGQSGRLDLQDALDLRFKGLLRPCWGFHGLELLYKILLDSNSIQAIIKGYILYQKSPACRRKG